MIKIKNKKTCYLNSDARRALCSTFLILCCYTQNIFAQTVPTNFFGINYWMPDQFINTPGSPGGFTECPNTQTQVLNAGVSLTRIGGGSSTLGYDALGTAWTGTTTTTNDYIAAIAAVKTINTGSPKFLIQVPFSSGITALQAKTMVNNIKALYPNDIFYYAIGNEWDKYVNTGVTPNRKYLASEIATLIKSYATQMKLADSRILIVAPSLSYYGATDGNSPAQAIMPILISGNGNANDITGQVTGQSYYYIDVVDYHTYAGGTNGDMSDIGSGAGHNYSDYRAASIAYPSGGFSTDLSTSSPGLQYYVKNANTTHSRTGSNALTYAITEMNIDWKNPPTPIEGNELTNSVVGLGARSFFAGQYWADMASAILKNGTNTSNAQVAFMNPWSINESSGDGSSFDLSMTKGVMTTCSDPAPQALSTYWHYQMVANNFTGTYYPNVSTAGGQTNYKAFACATSTKIRVLIMNQNDQSPRGADNSTNSFKINFSNTTPSGADMLFAFNTGNSTISGGGCTGGNYCCNIQKETTMYLEFDKTLGTITDNKVYSLQDALRGASDVGPMTWVGGTPSNIATSTDYSSYNSANVYDNINIVPTSALSAPTNNVFQFTNTAKIDGASGAYNSNGKTLCVTATSETTCH